METYLLVKCKKDNKGHKVRILSRDENSRLETSNEAIILDKYIENNGTVLRRDQMLDLIKDNIFYLYDFLVNEQKEVIKITINTLCENGCLIECRHFISQDKL